MTRKSETPAMVRRILCAQGDIKCPLCKEPLLPTDKLIREHMHALGLGGPDTEDNMAYVHKKCANKKTRGSGATTAGSDIGNIAKINRITGKTGQNKRKVEIANRGFPRHLRKKMNGKVEERT